MIADYAKPRYAQSYTGPEDRIFKPLFFGDMNEIGYRTKESFGIYPSSDQDTLQVTLLGWTAYWPYSVDITATFELQGAHRIRMEMVRY